MTARPIIQVSMRDFENRKFEIAKELWKAATEIGFFYLKDTCVSTEEVDKMFALSKAFFALTPEEKTRYKLEWDKNCGWESGVQKRPSAALPDLKESMQINWHGMEGRWPTDDLVPDFEVFTKEFMQKCDIVGQQVMSCFAIQLGFEEDFFAKKHVASKPDAQQTLRLLHYFSVEGEEVPEGTPRAGSHCDFSSISMLFCKGPGLEVCPGREAVSEFAQNGETWTPCPGIAGTITVNIGDALMRFSGDLLKSNFHRVTMPKIGEDQSARYSIAYFVQANKSAVIEDKTGKYQPITSGEFIKEALRGMYTAAKA